MRTTGKTLTVGALVAAAGMVIGVAPASAAPTYYAGDNCGISQTDYFRGEGCPNGVLISYHPDGVGATASLVGSISNLSAQPTYAYEGSQLVLQYYTDFVFWGAADADNSGESQGVRNNAGSIRNYSNHSYTLYVYPNYVGPSQTFGPTTAGNLNSTLRNNEASLFQH
jgi:hypothetical protein